ncbi:MAG: phasin family protein [Xanthobacteraceae bacterium]
MAAFAAVLEGSAVVEKLPLLEAIAAASRLAATTPNEDLNGSGPRDDSTLQQLDEVTLAAAESAKDYSARMLENLKVNINAAPASANGLAGAKLPTGVAERTADQPRKPEVGSDTLEGRLPAAAPVAKDYRAKAVELINANVNATLDYAQRLGTVKSAAEFIALSTSHAHRHLELIMKHAAGLAALAGTSPTKIRQTNNGLHRAAGKARMLLTSAGRDDRGD